MPNFLKRRRPPCAATSPILSQAPPPSPVQRSSSTHDAVSELTDDVESSQLVQCHSMMIMLSDRIPATQPSAQVHDNDDPHIAQCTTAPSQSWVVGVEGGGQVHGRCTISDWDVPPIICQAFHTKGLNQLFDWQIDCLEIAESSSHQQQRNFVYVAPTGGGKSLVADILWLRFVSTSPSQCRRILYLVPYVSLVHERFDYLQGVVRRSGISVRALHSNVSYASLPPTVNVIICTPEKANGIVNRHVADDTLNRIGMVIVDELHMLGDISRGLPLELLLTKIMYHNSNKMIDNIRIIGMSATLSNASHIANWLDARFYSCNRRPIELVQYVVATDARVIVKVCPTNINNQVTLSTRVESQFETDLHDRMKQFGLHTYRDRRYDQLFAASTSTSTSTSKNQRSSWNVVLGEIVWETIVNGGCVLVFVMTKKSAQSIVQLLYEMLNQRIIISLKDDDADRIRLIDQLQSLSSSSSTSFGILKQVIGAGMAYHHAGLLHDEKKCIENGFRNRTIHTLVCTSTLAAGVNLPADRVIIVGDSLYNRQIDVCSYRQMAGRSGRPGINKKKKKKMVVNGECYLFHLERPSNARRIVDLCGAPIPPISSPITIGGVQSFCRLLIDAISHRHIVCMDQLIQYASLSFAAHDDNAYDDDSLQSVLNESICELTNRGFISANDPCVALQLGVSAYHSGFSPIQMECIVTDLCAIRKCIILHDDLHLAWLCCPMQHTYVHMDWDTLFYICQCILETDDDPRRSTLQHLGIDLHQINRLMSSSSSSSMYHQQYSRIGRALIIRDIMHETSIDDIAHTYGVVRGDIQLYQHSTVAHANRIRIICEHLNYVDLALVLSEVVDRMEHGAHADLLPLLKLPQLKVHVARQLYIANYTTLSLLCRAHAHDLAHILRQFIPFVKHHTHQHRMNEQMYYMHHATLLIHRAQEYCQGRDYDDDDDDVDDGDTVDAIQWINVIVNEDVWCEFVVQWNMCSAYAWDIWIDRQQQQHSSSSSSWMHQYASPFMNPTQFESFDGTRITAFTVCWQYDDDNDKRIVYIIPLHCHDDDDEYDIGIDARYKAIHHMLMKQGVRKVTCCLKSRLQYLRKCAAIHIDHNDDDDDDNDNDNGISWFDDVFIMHWMSGGGYREFEGDSDGDDDDDDDGASLKDLFEIYIPSSSYRIICKHESSSCCVLDDDAIRTQWCIWMISVKMREILTTSSSSVYKCYLHVEMPLVHVIAMMEWYGIGFVNQQTIIDRMEINRRIHSLHVDAASLTSQQQGISLDNRQECQSFLQQHHHHHHYGSLNRHVLEQISLQRYEDEDDECVRRAQFANLLIEYGELKNVIETWSYMYDRARMDVSCNMYRIHAVYEQSRSCTIRFPNLYHRTMRLSPITRYSLQQDIDDAHITIHNLHTYDDVHRRVLVASRDDSRQLKYGILLDVLWNRTIDQSFESSSSSSLAEYWNANGQCAYTHEQAQGIVQCIVSVGSLSIHDDDDQQQICVLTYPADKVWRCKANMMLDQQTSSSSSLPRHLTISIRNALAAPRGYVLLCANYAHIEMRIAAHFSGAGQLRTIIMNNSDGDGDILCSIASHIQCKTVRRQINRQDAKAVLDCWLYGKSASSLAYHLQCSHAIAQSLIHSFEMQFPELVQCMEQCVESARTHGYVSTLLGRRRYLPHLHSPNLSKRNKAERQAFNTLCQGSAADCLKRAMISIHLQIGNSPTIPSSSMSMLSSLDHQHDALLVLQVHNQLIFEVATNQLERISRLIRHAMQNACSDILQVPLRVCMKQGPSWGMLQHYNPDDDTHVKQTT